MQTKTPKNVRFSYFLPYGMISRELLSLATSIAPESVIPYSLTIPMQDRISRCASMGASNSQGRTRMRLGGFLGEDTKRFGSGPNDKFSYFALTHSGLFQVTGTPDAVKKLIRSDDQYEDDWMVSSSANDSNKKGVLYRTRRDLQALVNFLYDCRISHNHDDPEMQDAYNTLFWDAVKNGDLTILSHYMNLAKLVNVSYSQKNGWQEYQQWRLTNINAMFRLNGFLCHLDRRPIETKWAFTGSEGEINPNDLFAKRAFNIPAFTQYALTDFYRNNPDAYSFDRPLASLSAERDKWLSTPAFYGIGELPGMKPDFRETGFIATGQQNIIRHTCVGVGIGTQRNYIIYHTKPKKELWRNGIEKTTATAVQSLIDQYSLKNPVVGAGRNIKNALIFYHTKNQFRALFNDILSNDPKDKIYSNYGYPYSTVNLISFDGAGIQQLRALMLSNPVDYISAIIYSVLQSNPAEFQRTNDPIYPLSYRGKPVFFAHDMEFFRLRTALRDYVSGRRFYVSCYPNQAVTLNGIMPEAEFL